ncbi:MAG: UDP-N-acetylmuramoyl-L-alanyl-D-glutamate--2,6-diaminopimelate ligase [Elusimicrobium sp.]|jgi:UDP-N-acetylmuramoyl-L-alanyl-D-glutamate--2,6-diaminopimelate ligase|nr:UDP-N-acetylmuramoyl-L-alanyl-D-glutamate--2,6-diaminopimelate ligase [Elusimicrobium sp.]
MNLRELLNIDSDVAVGEITQNSKIVVPGDVFFAVKGSKVDGNDYIDDAVSKGAVAVVSTEPAKKDYPVPYLRVDDIDFAMADAAVKFYKNPSKAFFVIGVTGTKGKTSITYMLESIFKEAGVPVSVIGTINYRINGEVFSKAPNTTPAALYLYYMLDEMRRRGTKVLVMEVSSHALELRRVHGIEFDLGIFTNLQRDHLDFHKTFENYFKAKEKLFTSIVENGKNTKTALVNSDDEYGGRLIKDFKDRLKIFECSLSETSDIKESLNGVDFNYAGRAGHINLLGRHNLHNALFALRAALAYGVDLPSALRGLAALKGVPGRMERIDCGQPFYVFVDFAYTTESMLRAYETLNPYKRGNIITVFGCGGERDATKRPFMGLAAAQNSSHVIITNDNPRREEPENIFKDILKGLSGYTNYQVIPDRGQAVKAGLRLCGEQDILLITGKGHEDYQILGNTTIPFSDQNTAKELLGELGYK